MKKSIALVAVVSSLLMSGCVIAINPSYADVHSERQLSLDAAQLTQLKVDAGAGSLTIKGRSGLDTINVQADIYNKDDSDANVELSLKTQGKRAELIAKIDTFGNWQGQSPRIDLVVNVPERMLLDIEDGSGSIDIRNIDNEIRIEDGSGSIKLKNIKGKLDIDDGSGRIDISQVTGDLRIKDGSGSIDIADVEGDLVLDDNSGSIEVDNLTGSADIEDGSGSITVEDIGGMVTIDDGSGSINVTRAGGLTILSDGSGGVSVRDVKNVIDKERDSSSYMK